MVEGIKPILGDLLGIGRNYLAIGFVLGISVILALELRSEKTENKNHKEYHAHASCHRLVPLRAPSS